MTDEMRRDVREALGDRPDVFVSYATHNVVKRQTVHKFFTQSGKTMTFVQWASMARALGLDPVVYVIDRDGDRVDPWTVREELARLVPEVADRRAIELALIRLIRLGEGRPLGDQDEDPGEG